MSWTAEDAMQEVIDYCIKGWNCKDIAIRYLEKELQNSSIDIYSEEAKKIRDKLSILQKEGEQDG